MSEGGESQGTNNQANLASGSGTTVNIQNSTIYNVAGTVNNPGHPAAATMDQTPEMQTQIKIDYLEKGLNEDTKAKSNFKIAGKFPTLHEPTSQFSPLMTKINNYFGDGIYEVNMDGFKSSMQITKGEPFSYQQFIQEITKGESKRIALIGGAGFGKTTELKKLAQTLLKNKDQKPDLPNQQQFKIIHWIDLKSLQDEETTLQELLFDDLDLSEEDSEFLLDWIKHNQSKVIFLFDGLDQTRFKTNKSHDKTRGLKKKKSAGCLIHNLLSGYIFPDVKIVTTSREHSITTLPEEARPDLVIALTGFTQNDAEKLFCEVSGENNDEAMKNIRELDIIKIPIYTIFTAVVHKFYKNDIPRYVSCLLAKILEIFTKCTQMREINVKYMENLHKLMAMAYEGMKAYRVTFDIEDLKRHGLNEVDVSDMMTKVPKEDMHLGLLMEGDIVLMFCHQTLQEFLAACYISKMKFDDYKAFTYDCIKLKGIDEEDEQEEFEHWSVVVQYLAGITLNSEFKIDERIIKATDKDKKQEILRYAVKELVLGYVDAPECLVLHESNDDSLIRQLEEIYISTLNSNLTRAISSLMRRKESMKVIALRGVTDEFLRIMAENVKGSRLRVERLALSEDKWDVSCETLNYFLSDLEVNELGMEAFPTDYHEKFPNFQNVRILKISSCNAIVTAESQRVLVKCGDELCGEFNKNARLLTLDIKGSCLHDAVAVQNICFANKIQVTAKERCIISNFKSLHVMLDPKYEVDGKDMDLEVRYWSELNTLVTGCSDIREAVTRWSVRSLKVKFEVESRKFLQKFKAEIGDTKIHHFALGAPPDKYIFGDDDFKITASIVNQCQVERLALYDFHDMNRCLRPRHLEYILQNCKLKTLKCWCDHSAWSSSVLDSLAEAEKVSATKLRVYGLELLIDVFASSDEGSDLDQFSESSDEDSSSEGDFE